MKLWLLAVVFLALMLRLIITYNNFNNPHFSIQQDKYADYSVALKNGEINNKEKFSQVETRLFPGYPLIILLVSKIVGNEITSGVIISLLSSILAVFIFWTLTKNLLFTAFFSFFPPAWVIQSTKVATEPVSLMFLLLSLFLYKNKKFFLSGLSIGMAFDIRLISVCLLIALIIISFKKHLYKSFISILLGFIIFFLLLLVYNFTLFGQDGLFKQFQTYYSINNVTIGAVQLVKDVFRAIDWKQYRILFSAMFYIAINLFALFQLYKYKNKSLVYYACFFWMLFSLLFIFSLGPTPMLEEFSRFSVPFTPALVLGLSTLIKGIKNEKRKDI